MNQGNSQIFGPVLNSPRELSDREVAVCKGSLPQMAGESKICILYVFIYKYLEPFDDLCFGWTFGLVLVGLTCRTRGQSGVLGTFLLQSHLQLTGEARFGHGQLQRHFGWLIQRTDYQLI